MSTPATSSVIGEVVRAKEYVKGLKSPARGSSKTINR